jgi:CubicO group peptidase (beta-lactamase class C family)
MTTIDGWVAPGFEPVRRVFEENFESHGEAGAAYAAYHRGRRVVDLWGGTADITTGRPWEEDTVIVVYSTTKGVTAMCANRLAQEGRIDVEAPVATYWPEFAQAGKEDVTVADLLAHRAGLAWVDGTMTAAEVFAWDPVVEALAAQAPSWPRGTAHGYHATTYGWLVGEVVRRVTGRSLGTYLREEIAGPLGADFYIGLPASEHGRVARLISFIDTLASGDLEVLAGGFSGEEGGGMDMAEMMELAKVYLAPDGPLTKSLSAPGGALADEKIWESPALWSAELPAANGMCDARSLACLYGACVSDVETPSGSSFRILTPEQLDRALEPRTEGPDAVLFGLDLQWGLGFMLNRGLIGAAGLGGPKGFGHFGMGGSVGWGDPDAELGMGYVMNRMTMGTTGDLRSFRLMSATYEAAAVAG